MNTPSIQKQKPVPVQGSNSEVGVSTSSKYQLTEEDKRILRSTSWQTMINVLVDKR